MNRRLFLKDLVLSGVGLSFGFLVGCGREKLGTSMTTAMQQSLDEGLLYDTYAVSLYFDGSIGPKTGIIKASYVLGMMPVTFEFWHGHGGRAHYFTLYEEHYLELKKLKKVTLETTEVESHRHKLFIDPSDPQWRVPGSEPLPIP